MEAAEGRTAHNTAATDTDHAVDPLYRLEWGHFCSTGTDLKGK